MKDRRTFPGYTVDTRGDEVNAYYVLHGHFDPDEITALVGIQPTDTWHIGEVTSSRSGRRTDVARWKLQPRVASPVELEDRISAVLIALEPAFDRFCELGQRYEATIQCVVYAHGAQAGQHFEREHIRQAGLLNAAIDLDLYALGEADES